MNVNNGIAKLKKLQNLVDWRLLLFLLLFLNVKLAVKIPAIIIICLLRPNFKFGFSFRDSRLPLFYPAVIAIGLVDVVLNHGYSNQNYIVAAMCGVGFWVLCILAMHQVKLFVERNDVKVVQNTLLVFFVLNAAVSLLNMAAIIWETHALNPYLYQGQYQKYFISTGDFIKGVTFDTSVTNAVINAFGVIYFLDRKNVAMTLICMAILLMAGSNFTNMILVGILVLQFIFKSTRNQKSVITVCVMFLVVFMAKISPQNNEYVVNAFKTLVYKRWQKGYWPTENKSKVFINIPDSLLSADERKQKVAQIFVDSVERDIAIKKKPDPVVKNIKLDNAGRIEVPKPDLNGPTYQWLRVTPPEQKQLVEFVNTHKAELPISGKPYQFSYVPGKLTGFKQTLGYYEAHPAKAISGLGMSNFSSKLAFRATGLKFTGGYPAKYAYINPLFMVNHLDVYLNYFSKNPELHSLANSPFSVYDQLFAEYGVLGLLALGIFYFWFFAKRFKRFSYGIPLLLFVSAQFFIDAGFGRGPVLALFELMMFRKVQ